MHGLNTLAYLNELAHARSEINARDPGHTVLRELRPYTTPVPDIAIVHRSGEVWFHPRTERGFALAEALLDEARRDGNFFILSGPAASAAVEAIYLDRDAKALGL